VHAGLAAGWAFLSPLLVFDARIHWAAIVVIVAGVGIQAGRLARARPARVAAVNRYGSPALAGVLLLAVVGGGILERRHRVGPPQPDARPPDGPNVLLLLLDTVRACDLSLYGYPLPTTPYLETLARGGVVFEQAIAPAPWTLPTHATLFTGRWPSELEADWLSPLESSPTTLAEVFRGRGYRTGGFVANLQATSTPTGLGQGFETYQDYLPHLEVLIRAPAVGRRLFDLVVLPWLGERPLGRKPAREIRQSFLDWVGEGGERPFFAFLNFFDAHLPYDPAPEHLGRVGPVTQVSAEQREARLALRSDSAWTRERRLRYDEAIASIDEEIRTIVAALETRRLLDRTVIVVTSDHGELFGEHGLLGHGHSLYLNEIRVPLLIWNRSGLPAGARIGETVSLRDLGRTILDLAGIETAALGGTTLRSLWEGDSTLVRSPAISMVTRIPDRRSRAPVARGDMVSVIQDGFHYILNGDSTVELYELGEGLAQPTALDHDANSAALGRLDSIVRTVWRGRASRASPLKEGTQIARRAGPGPFPPVLAAAAPR
jgi:arylsulfatase A-like enzyme